jgi:glycosyltransferase involved in cell wall biosynthesis
MTQLSETSADAENLLDVSIIIPVLDEEESLPELYRQLTDVLTGMRVRYELLFIDDGSHDESANWMRQTAESDTRVRALIFRRHYGKSAALAVGFQEVRGQFVITIDADLQDDPAEIPHLLKKMEEGYDMVTGWKKKRHDPISKRLPSKVANFVTSVVSGVKLHDMNCGLKAYRRDVVKSIQVYGELHRYIPVLVSRQGFRIGEQEVEHHARKYGHSKFGARRFFTGFLDLLTVTFLSSYVHRPLHLFGLAGAGLFAIGGITGARLAYLWAIGQSVTGRPSQFLAIICLIIGFQLISIGLIGELIVHSRQGRVGDFKVKEYWNSTPPTNS